MPRAAELRPKKKAQNKKVSEYGIKVGEVGGKLQRNRNTPPNYLKDTSKIIERVWRQESIHAQSDI